MNPEGNNEFCFRESLDVRLRIKKMILGPVMKCPFCCANIGCTDIEDFVNF